MIRSEAQTFPDGVVTVYALEGDRLVKREGPLRYEERTVGVTRYYTALHEQEDIQMVIRVPRRDGIQGTDVCVLQDGRQYVVQQVQRPKGIWPPVCDLALERLGVDYEIQADT